MKETADATAKSQAVFPFSSPPPRLGPLVTVPAPTLQSRGFHQLISPFPPSSSSDIHNRSLGEEGVGIG